MTLPEERHPDEREAAAAPPEASAAEHGEPVGAPEGGHRPDDAAPAAAADQPAGAKSPDGAAVESSAGLPAEPWSPAERPAAVRIGGTPASAAPPVAAPPVLAAASADVAPDVAPAGAAPDSPPAEVPAPVDEGPSPTSDDPATTSVGAGTAEPASEALPEPATSPVEPNEPEPPAVAEPATEPVDLSESEPPAVAEPATTPVDLSEPEPVPVAEPASAPVELGEPHADSTAHEAATGAPADPPAGRGRGGLLRALAPVLALALVAVLLIVSGIFAWQLHRDARADTARTKGLTAARDAARVLFSYDYTHLDKDFAAGTALTTGTFRDQYKQTTNTVVRPVAQQYNAVVKADVQEAGVVRVDYDCNHLWRLKLCHVAGVTTVEFVNQTTTSTRVQGPKVDQSRIRMALRDVGGHWLVDRVDAL